MQIDKMSGSEALHRATGAVAPRAKVMGATSVSQVADEGCRGTSQGAIYGVDLVENSVARAQLEAVLRKQEWAARRGVALTAALMLHDKGTPTATLIDSAKLIEAYLSSCLDLVEAK